MLLVILTIISVIATVVAIYYANKADRTRISCLSVEDKIFGELYETQKVKETIIKNIIEAERVVNEAKELMPSCVHVGVVYDENAYKLEKAHGNEDLCYDIKVPCDVELHSGMTAVPTGIRINFPKGIHAIVDAKSGNTMKGIRVVNEKGEESRFRGAKVKIGYIDQGYRNEIGVMLECTAFKGTKVIKKGTAIAQMYFVRGLDTHLFEETVVSNTKRGENGFGSGHHI